MSDGFYVGMAAASARQQQLDIIADNLANVTTPGFKATRPRFETALRNPGEGKILSSTISGGLDMRPGAMMRTGNSLDIVPEEGTFLSVRAPSGQAMFTRNGKLSVDGDGQLLAGSHPLLDASGHTIIVPAGVTPAISPTGIVAHGSSEIGRLALYRVEGPMHRVGGSLLDVNPGVPANLVDAKVRIGELEGSNATALGSTVDMVATQRQFEHALQAIEIYKKLTDRGNEIGRVR